jgi:hypothetical protein
LAFFHVLISMLGPMAKKKKHSKAEIAAKLTQADELSREGKLQSEIARALGVSVMTLHRWRKAPSNATREPASTGVHQDANAAGLDHDQKKRIADLQVENARLRKLVTDLLLEKMKLEEAAQSPSNKRAAR